MFDPVPITPIYLSIELHMLFASFFLSSGCCWACCVLSKLTLLIAEVLGVEVVAMHWPRTGFLHTRQQQQQ